MLYIFKPAYSDNFHSRALTELAKGLNGLLMLIFINSWNTKEAEKIGRKPMLCQYLGRVNRRTLVITDL